MESLDKIAEKTQTGSKINEQPGKSAESKFKYGCSKEDCEGCSRKQGCYDYGIDTDELYPSYYSELRGWR